MSVSLRQLAEQTSSELLGLDEEQDVQITGVQHDSRAVGPGQMFAALVGANVDGHAFAEQACAKGASALLVERPLRTHVPQLLVSDARRSLGPIASFVYGEPTRRLATVGITGTNGKTTVAWLVEQTLRALDFSPAVLGTLRAYPGQTPEAAVHTTPEADDIARFADEVLQRGGDALVMETSSHALAMHRVDGIDFDVAAFTNLSQDHLDFHHSMDAYGAAKARLFSELSPRETVINIDDTFGQKLAADLPYAVTTSTRASAGAVFSAQGLSFHRGGFTSVLETPWGAYPVDVPLVGRHNLENLLVALGIVHALGKSAKSLLAQNFFSTLRGAPGRMQRVPHPNNVLLFVDYAHTPDALARALDAARGVTDGTLWVVFGCGGDRDRGKRPLMAQAAEQSADKLVITSDNPRTEDPEAIIAQVVAGLATPQSAHVDVDRRQAIRHAVANAKPGDTIVVAGKGHEDYQILGTERVHLSDVEELEAAVAESFGKNPSPLAEGCA